MTWSGVFFVSTYMREEEAWLDFELKSGVGLNTGAGLYRRYTPRESWMKGMTVSQHQRKIVKFTGGGVAGGNPRVV